MWEISKVEDYEGRRITRLVNTARDATVTTQYQQADALARSTNPGVPVRFYASYVSFTRLPVRVYHSVSPINTEE